MADEKPSIIAEVIEEGAEIVVEVAEAIVEAAETVEEVAAVATEIAEEVKAVAEEVIEVASEVADEAPPAAAVLEIVAPAVTFVEPTPSLVDAVKTVAPAKYADLGKEARDLINKDIHTVQKLKVTTKSANGFQITTEGSHNSASGVVAASVETKLNCAGCGVSVATKWNTDSVILNTISLANKGLDGLNVDIDTTHSLVSGKKTMKVSTAYTGSALFHPTLDLDVADITKPNVDFSLVLAHQGFHAGYQTSFESASSSLLGHNVSVGYKANNLVLHGAVENASKFIGSVFYNIKEGLSAAAHVAYAPGASPSVTLCGKYDIDAYTSMKAKIDQNLTLGCSYTTQVKGGLSLTGAGILNAKALNSGGHKVGLSLSFDS